MGFFGRNKITAGLDIGSGMIKLVVVDHSKAQPEIVQVATSPLVPDAIVEGEIMDPVLVADTIQSLVQSVGLKNKRVVAAVGGHDVIIKRLQMDRMSVEDAREVIRWEAESTFRSTWRTCSSISRSWIRKATVRRCRSCSWRPSAS
jgi:type IV pilus assembly protein PilM